MATQSDSGIDLVKETATDPAAADQSDKKAKAAATPVALASGEQAAEEQAAEEAQPEEEQRSGRRFLLTNAVPSWMVSLIVHTILLMVLGFMVLPMEPEKTNVRQCGTARRSSTTWSISTVHH